VQCLRIGHTQHAGTPAQRGLGPCACGSKPDLLRQPLDVLGQPLAVAGPLLDEPCRGECLGRSDAMSLDALQGEHHGLEVLPRMLELVELAACLGTVAEGLLVALLDAGPRLGRVVRLDAFAGSGVLRVGQRAAGRVIQRHPAHEIVVAGLDVGQLGREPVARALRAQQVARGLFPHRPSRLHGLQRAGSRRVRLALDPDLLRQPVSSERVFNPALASRRSCRVAASRCFNCPSRTWSPWCRLWSDALRHAGRTSQPGACCPLRQ
jgi:hypothetical protein